MIYNCILIKSYLLYDIGTQIKRKYKFSFEICFSKQLEQELEKSFTGEEVLKEITQKEEKEWQLCLAINNDWNAEVASARDERIAKEKEVERQKILEQLITQEEEKQKRLNIIEEQVRLEKVILH